MQMFVKSPEEIESRLFETIFEVNTTFCKGVPLKRLIIGGSRSTPWRSCVQLNIRVVGTPFGNLSNHSAQA
jgi:hypothetical protein